MIRLLLLSLLLTFSSTVTDSAAAETAADMPLPGGTVISIDLESSSLTLQSPSGELRLLVVVNQRLLRDIKINDHVIFEMNEVGEVTKLLKLPTDPAN